MRWRAAHYYFSLSDAMDDMIEGRILKYLLMRRAGLRQCFCKRCVCNFDCILYFVLAHKVSHIILEQFNPFSGLNILEYSIFYEKLLVYHSDSDLHVHMIMSPKMKLKN